MMIMKCLMRTKSLKRWHDQCLSLALPVPHPSGNQHCMSASQPTATLSSSLLLPRQKRQLLMLLAPSFHSIHICPTTWGCNGQIYSDTMPLIKWEAWLSRVVVIAFMNITDMVKIHSQPESDCILLLLVFDFAFTISHLILQHLYILLCKNEQNVFCLMDIRLANSLETGSGVLQKWTDSVIMKKKVKNSNAY